MPDSLWNKVEGAFNGVKDVVEDIATIDVVTLTGKIEINHAIENGKIDLKKLYENIENAGATGGAGADNQTTFDLSIVAFSHIEIDADAINFVSNEITDDNKALLTAHYESVKAAQETRDGIVRMVRSFFK